MSIQFPDKPSLNETFPYAGMTYVWDGEKWTASGAAAFEDAYVNKDGDTMTGDLTVPNLISEGDVQTTSLNGGPLAGLRNQIINGDFRIWQRGTAGYTNPGSTIRYGSVDRWGIQDASAGNHLAQSGNSPAGFDYSATIDGQANGTIRHRIELFNGNAGPFVSGSRWTLSVWATNQIRARVLDDDGNTFLAMGNMTATTETSGDFTRYVQSFPMGEDASGDFLEVALQNQSGSLMRVTGVQLEPGPQPTPFEHRPIGLELSLCQRYYQRLDGSPTSTVTAYNSGNGQCRFVWSCARSVVMRATPTTETGNLSSLSTTRSGTSTHWNFRSGFASINQDASLTNATADAEL